VHTWTRPYTHTFTSSGEFARTHTQMSAISVVLFDLFWRNHSLREKYTLIHQQHAGCQTSARPSDKLCRQYHQGCNHRFLQFTPKVWELWRRIRFGYFTLPSQEQRITTTATKDHKQSCQNNQTNNKIAPLSDWVEQFTVELLKIWQILTLCGFCAYSYEYFFDVMNRPINSSDCLINDRAKFLFSSKMQ
jgi:hypothetical protein